MARDVLRPAAPSADAAIRAGTLIVVGGPTASGKTRAAVQLAKHYRAEIVSADARQFYHALRIGAALPTVEEMQGVVHHFVGHLDLSQPMSAGAYERAAVPVIEELLAKRGVAILVGGSGLYIDAVLNGFDPMPAGDDRIRAELQERFREKGLPPLIERLSALDPATLARIDAQNPHRVIRALEVCLATGLPYSAQRTGEAKSRPWRTILIAMDLPRTELYARIDARVESMVAAGLVQEVRDLMALRELNALQTVGYKELFSHFDGAVTLDEAIASVKQHSRNYAKRQMTWLRRSDAWNWVAPADTAAMITLIDRISATPSDPEP